MTIKTGTVYTMYGDDDFWKLVSAVGNSGVMCEEAFDIFKKGHNISSGVSSEFYANKVMRCVLRDN